MRWRLQPCGEAAALSITGEDPNPNSTPNPNPNPNPNQVKTKTEESTSITQDNTLGAYWPEPDAASPIRGELTETPTHTPS